MYKQNLLREVANVFDTVKNNVDSIDEPSGPRDKFTVGSNLSFLMYALLTQSDIYFWEDHMDFVSLLAKLFPGDHSVWNTVRLQNIHIDWTTGEVSQS